MPWPEPVTLTGPHARLELRIEPALRVDVLENSLDHHVRERRAFAAYVCAQAAHGLRRCRRILQALLQEVLGPVERRLNQRRAPILQGDVHAPQRRPRRNVPAHHAGADHVHTAKLDRRLAAQPFQSILQ